MLQIQGPEELKAFPVGNSDALEVGDFALAIDNPFALGQSVPPATCALSDALASASGAMRTSSIPTLRSTPAIPAAHWSAAWRTG